MEIVETFDYCLFFFYGLLFYGLTKKILRRNSTPQEMRWFFTAWFLKMSACLAYTWMIVYYYGYGDSLTYYGYGDMLRNAVIYDPTNLSYFFRSASSFGEAAHYFTKGIDLSASLGYYNEPNFVIHRLSALLSFLTFNRFVVISMIFANLGFWGFVFMYKGLSKLFPEFQRQIMIAALFIPSCVFWSSGLAKEPVCIFCEGIIFYNVVAFLLQKSIGFIRLLLTLVAGYILYTVKSYIFVCLVAGLALWFLYQLIQESFKEKPIIRFSLFTLLLTALAFPVLLLWSSVQTAISENIGETIAASTTAYKSIYDYQSGGSLIEIETFDYKDPAQILAFLPSAIVNVMFRPWPWEVSNVLMILTVLENIFFTYLFVRTLLFTRFFTRNAALAKNFQVFVVVFSVLLALVIGISTFNFGTLVRYRIPFLPFWVFLLLVKSRKDAAQPLRKNSPYTPAYGVPIGHLAAKGDVR